MTKKLGSATWTKEQMEALADRFARVFVETVEHAGGTATIVDNAAAPPAVKADSLPGADNNQTKPLIGNQERKT